MPRVSITIPTFNCARFLGRAIDSALAQTYADYEIIVVDDGSTDDTREVLARFGDRIRYVYQPNGAAVQPALRYVRRPPPSGGPSSCFRASGSRAARRSCSL